MKTYSAKPTDITRKWYVVDASDAPLGRLSTQIAKLLLGKDKPQFTKHIDCGDYVIVINSENLVVTGDKSNKKIYYQHSGFPGGIKDATLSEKMTKDSRQVIVKAVRGMLPDNKLRAERLKRLKVYTDANHSHEAQQPVKLNLGKEK
jgi:large subunit ribosomal protein L13